MAGFTGALRAAGQAGVQVALSKPCFELWLLLHHLDAAAAGAFATAAEVEGKLREMLAEYNKRKLRAEHYPLTSVAEACARARSLDPEVPGGDIPAGSTSRVYRIWEAIAQKALLAQLPGELRGLLL